MNCPVVPALIGILMITRLMRCAVLVLAFLPVAAAAEPVTLKFAYFTSDRTATYRAAIKPFVDAVNAAGAGKLQIEIHFSGALGRNPAQQLQLVLDGTADFAFIVTGYTPDQFPDNGVIELPGLYQNIEEATLVYTSLIAANALRGYQDLFVVGAFATDPETIHTRIPVRSLDDLRGKRIRYNNPMQAAALTILGIEPKSVPINGISAAIGKDEIDGATVPPAALFEFGIARMTSNHYLLRTGVAPLAVVMNRKKFEGLSKENQNIIRKYSGQWAAQKFVELYGAENKDALTQLRSDPNRKVIIPSQKDSERAQAAFVSVTKDWIAADPVRQQLLMKAEAEVSKIRSGQ
jgi:TRAP-type C4-dicarboxylate transport system substrate-binding protein